MRQPAVAAILAALLGLAAPARAGDGAALEVYGFSPDGARFLFEQWGSEDGSGFPYSELLLIDADTGRPIEGAPFRARIESEGADPEDARQAAARQAKPVFVSTQFRSEKMASVVNQAIRPFDELLPMEIWPIQEHETEELALPASALGPGKITIEQRAAAGGHCLALAEGRAKALKLSFVAADGRARTLHDGEPPDAAGCPTRFGVAGVYLHPRPGGAFSLVVILSAYPLGFEGPDRRFIAFAARIPAPG